MGGSSTLGVAIIIIIIIIIIKNRKKNASRVIYVGQGVPLLSIQGRSNGSEVPHPLNQFYWNCNLRRSGGGSLGATRRVGKLIEEGELRSWFCYKPMGGAPMGAPGCAPGSHEDWVGV